jgi:Na+/H+ antiporter NhaC
MENYSFWSLIPPLIAIVLAIKTRQVFISLIFGIWLGWLILSGGNIIEGTFATIQAFVDVFKDEGNTRTILFSCLVGVICLINRYNSIC